MAQPAVLPPDDLLTPPDDLQSSEPSFPDLIRDVGERSGPDAVSRKNAQGVMQVIPSTNVSPGFGVRPAADDSPQERERVGREYAQAMLAQYGDPALAAAAYDAGPGTLDDWMNGTNKSQKNPGLLKLGDPRKGQIARDEFVNRIPFPETRDYAKRIAAQYQPQGGNPADAGPPSDLLTPPDDLQDAAAPSSGGHLLTYDTPLSAPAEAAFQDWKQRYAPNDSGYDYDLRGAFKAGVTPDPATGHWPDTFKKPNHPTFSDQSQYAAVRPDLAGHWEGGTYVPPAAPKSFAPQPAPATAAVAPLENVSGFGSALRNVEHFFAPVGQALQSAFPPRSQGMPNPAEAALQGVLHSGREIGQTATGGTNVLPETSSAAAPIDFTHGFNLEDVASKLAYGAGKSAPVITGGILGGAAGEAFAPEATPLSGLVGGAAGAGVATVAQRMGPAFAEELARTPKDRNGAFERAWARTGIDAAGSAVGWAAFGMDPFKNQIKNLIFQGVTVQPAIASAQQAAQNVVSGRPVGENVEQAATQSLATTPLLLAGHGVVKAVSGLRGRAGEAPGGPEAPGAEEGPGATAPSGGAGPSGTGPEPVLPFGTPMELRDPKGGAPVPVTAIGQIKGGRYTTLKYADGHTKDFPTDYLTKNLFVLPPAAETGTAAEEGKPVSEEERFNVPPDDLMDSTEAIIKRLDALLADPDLTTRRAREREPGEDADEEPVTGPRSALTIQDEHDAEVRRLETEGMTGAKRLGPVGIGSDRQAPVKDETPPMGLEAEGVTQPQGERSAPAENLPQEGSRAAPVKEPESDEDIEPARANVEQPTPAQSEAGNYRKGHIANLHGMDITIETPRGTARSGVSDAGHDWSNVNNLADYGYIKGTTGADKEHLDVYIGPNPKSENAYVIDQIHPETGEFDEIKAVLGADTPKQAAAIYDDGFSDGSGPSRRYSITAMPVAEFRDWAKTHGPKSPVEPQNVGEFVTHETKPVALPSTRALDDNKRPIFHKGERVVINDEGPHNGRHGTISEANALVMAPLFGGNRTTTYHYRVKTDEGSETFSNNLQDETAKPGKVIPDPVVEGHPTPPWQVKHSIDYAKKSAKTQHAMAGRARKRESRDAHLRSAQESEKKAANYQAVLDAWTKQYPQAAAKHFPVGEKPAPPVASPKPEAPVAKATFTENEAKDGVEVRFKERPDDATLGRMKASGFRWSKFQKLWYAKRTPKTLGLARELAGVEVGDIPVSGEGTVKSVEKAPVSVEIHQNPTESPGAPPEKPAEPSAPATPNEKRAAEMSKFRDLLERHGAARQGKTDYVVQSHVGPHGTMFSLRRTEDGIRTTMGGAIHQGGGWSRSKAIQEAVEDAFPATPTEQANTQAQEEGGRAELDAALYQPAAMPITSAAPPPPKVSRWRAGDQVDIRPEYRHGTRQTGRTVTDVTPDGALITLDGGLLVPREYIVPAGTLPSGTKTPTLSTEADHGLQGPLRPGTPGERPEAVHGSPPQQQTGPVPPAEIGGGPRVAPPTPGLGTQGGGRPAQRPPGPAAGGGAGHGADAGIPGTREGSEPGTAGRPPDAEVQGTDYRIDPGEIEEGRGPKAKALDNLAAIELVKRIHGDGRLATREEQGVLAKYVGWGGISGAFRNSQGKFGTGFEDIGKRLEALLTPEEHATASRSTQYAHYTAEHVIRSMWDAVARMGFEGGSVFESGMGIGHFLGMMPPDIAAKSEYQGIEMDHLTADIAKLLYPRSGVRQADFTQTPIPDNAFDLVIGNPPFADTIIKADPKYSARGFMLHDYFFAKSMDALRPGGLMAFVTSAGTMNKLDNGARGYLGQRAAFLGGVRLPSTAFKKNAGTEVTTDILFFQKRAEPIAPKAYDEMFGKENPEAIWGDTVTRDLPDNDGKMGKVAVSRYFTDHPEMVLGKEGRFDKLYQGRYAVHAIPGADLERDLAAALETLPKDIFAPIETPAERAEQDFSAPETKDGSFYLKDGVLHQYDGGVGRMVPTRGAGVEGGMTAADRDRVRHLIPVRDALRDVFKADLAENVEDGALARAALNAAYDTFTGKFGPINKAEFQYRRPTIVQQEVARAEQREGAIERGEHWAEGDFSAVPHLEGNRIEDIEEGESAGAKRKGPTWAQIARLRQEARDAAKAAGKPFSEGSFSPEEMPDVVIDRRPNIKAFMDDPESYRLRAIEDYDDQTGEAKKRRVFYESVLTRESEPDIRSAQDGVLWSLNKYGRLDLDKIAAKRKQNKAALLAELGDSVFQVPGTRDTYQMADEYLSGDILDKLATAKAFAESDASMARNVAALEAARPAPLPPTEIRMSLGMPWIPSELVTEFARDHLGISTDIYIRHSDTLGGWTVTAGNQGPNFARWGTQDLNATRLLQEALNKTRPRIYRTVFVDGNRKQEFDAVATQAVSDRIDEITRAWADYDSVGSLTGGWLHDNEGKLNALAETYNDTLNRTALRKFDGSYLTTPGVASDWRWRPHQRRGVARIILAGNTYVAHAVGAGKAQPLDAKVLTPSGWALMGDVQVGDFVITVDGSATMVRGVFPQGEKEIFRVRFSDGSETECCDEHLWQTWDYGQRSAAQVARRRGRSWTAIAGSVRSLREIRGTLVSPHLGAKNHSIPIVAPVAFGARQLSLDPYVMGVLLGDGSMSSHTVCLSTADDELRDEFARRLPAMCEVRWNSAYDYRIVFSGKRYGRVGDSNGGTFASNPVKGALARYGLLGSRSHEKFVPDDYLFNTAEARIAVLQGLMDTDGCVGRRGTSVCFTSTSRKLADGVIHLVQSLGGTASLTVKKPMYSHRGVRKLGRDAYNLTIKMPAAINPFRLSRKASAVVPKGKYGPVRYIVGVEPVGRKPAQCIAVENPSQLYVTDGFIVTHNTSLYIGAGMEMRRLGLVKKPMYAVPNSMLGQFTKEFYEQYPNARIAVADERRFHTSRRKQFIANVAQEDLDAVIITHSAFGMIPIGAKFQNDLIQEELDRIDEALDGLDKQADRITIKKLENKKEKMEQRLRGAFSSKKDKTNTFEEMGVDFLFVDEAHMFRKLDFASRQNIKGIDGDGSRRAFDLYSKVRYLDSKTPGRSVVMGSGTPVTNTMGELYTLSKYMQREALEKRGMSHFDSWSSAFGDVTTNTEPTPQGTYERVTRFARFVNAYELYKMVGEVMDIVTPQQLEQYVVRPKVKGGKRQLHLAPKTEAFEHFQQSLVRRVEEIKRRKGPPKKGDDILLSVINDGRHAAIDLRFVQMAQNDPASKLNEMLENAASIYDKSKDTHFFDPATNYQRQISRGPATQMIFSNLGVNGRGPMDFSGYKWIRQSLIHRGVAKEHIAFIGDYKSSVARQKLFNDMNAGKIRVLIGSTQKMGMGVNAQRRLIAMHNLDPLWFPSDDEQRVGRGLRQGNWNPEIEIHDYATKGTYDEQMWQMMGRKARFIEQFFRGDPTLRTMEDLGEASFYEQASAIAASDERVIRLTEMKHDLERLERQSAGHAREQYSMRSKLAYAQDEVAQADKAVPAIELDIAQRIPTRGDKFSMMVGRTEFSKRQDAADALGKEIERVLETPHDVPVGIGSLGGFPILVEAVGKGGNFVLMLRRSNRSLDQLRTMAQTPRGYIGAIEDRLGSFEDRIKYWNKVKAQALETIASLRTQIGKEFPKIKEIAELRQQVARLERQISPSKPLTTVAEADKAIQENANDYHAGRIGHQEFTERANELQGRRQRLLSPPSSEEPQFQVAPRGWETADAGGEEGTGGDIRGTKVTGEPLGEMTPAESRLVDEVQAIVKRLAPKAPSTAQRKLRAGPYAIHGVTYGSAAGRAIAWALEAPLGPFDERSPADVIHTARHEVVHWLKGEGFYTPEEWATLEAKAEKENWIAKHGIPSRYNRLSHEQQIEESIAEEFGDGRFNHTRWPGPEIIRRLFRRLALLLGQIAATARRLLGKSATAEDIFTKMESGEIGRRNPARAEPLKEAAQMQTAYHGSPHDFDEFDTAKIGSGEGAQVYGHGLYFAGKKEVAEYYRDRLGGGWEYNGLPYQAAKLEIDDPLEREAAKFLVNMDGNKKSASDMMRMIGQNKNPVWFANDIDAALDTASGKLKRVTTGKLYHVDLKPKEGEYLDWDKPLSEQGAAAKASLEKIKAQLEKADLLDEYSEQKNADFEEWTGEELVRQIIPRMITDDAIPASNGPLERAIEDGETAKATSLYLKDIGIPGTRYADQGSRNVDARMAAAKAEIPQVKKNIETIKRNIDAVESGRLGPTNKAQGTELEREHLKFHEDRLADLEREARGEQTHNYVIFSAEDVGIEAKFQRPKAPPTTAAEGKEALDDMVDSAAAGGGGTGAAASAKGFAPPPKGRPTKHLSGAFGIVERSYIMPRTLAATDWRSAKYWDAIQRRDDEATKLLHEAAEGSQQYVALAPAQRKALHGVEELARLKGLVLDDDGHPIVMRSDIGISREAFMRMNPKRMADALYDAGIPRENTEDIVKRMRDGDPVTIQRALDQLNPHLEHSKFGDVIELDPQATAAYHERRKLFRQRWRDLMRGAARKLGWDGEPDADTIRAAADKEEREAGKNKLYRLAGLMEAMAAQERNGYVPFMRFGDYYLAVTPKRGTDMKSLGGFPRTLEFRLVDSAPPFGGALSGTTRRTGETPEAAKAMIAELGGRYDPSLYDVQHGYLSSKPELLRNLDIPAIEKLLTVLGQKDTDLFGPMVEEIQNKMYEELTAGFKRRASNTPGYDGDFARASGSYLHWTSRHVADQVHGEAMRRAKEQYIDGHPDRGTRQYWTDWDMDQKRPATFMRALQRFGFYWELAGNPSSSAAIALHGPMVANFTLGVGLGSSKTGTAMASAKLYPALAQVGAAIRADTETGLHIDLASIKGLTPREAAGLEAADKAGILHSAAADELMGMQQGGFDDISPQGKLWARSLKVASSNISVVDRMNRTAIWLAAHRLALTPGVLKKWANVWGDNQLYREMAEREGITAESMARFMVDEAAFVWGKKNQPQIARGTLGSMLFTFRGFELRYLSAAWRNAHRMGVAGKLSAMMMMAGLAALAGALGLPFVEDVESAIEALSKLFLRIDPMLEAKLYSLMGDTWFGKRGAEFVLRGPARSALGVDLSNRLGFGNIVGKDFDLQANPFAVAGAVPGILYNSITSAANRYRRGQYLGAVAPMLPAFARNPYQAAVVYPNEGVRTQYQKKFEPPVVSPQDIDTADKIAKSLGLQPSPIARAYEKRLFEERLAAAARLAAPQKPTKYKSPEQRVPRRARKASPYPQ